jgi:MFS-type transporter involved in bile tolerance (Atg22 family)
MTFFWASRANAELIKVICASLLAHLSTEVTVDEQSEHPESQTILYSMYNPHSDLAVFLALVSLAFLLRIFSGSRQGWKGT